MLFIITEYNIRKIQVDLRVLVSFPDQCSDVRY